MSVVIPVFNEPTEAAATVGSLIVALAAAPAFTDAEIVIADDGSGVDVFGPAKAAAGAVSIRHERLRQNAGRFEARRSGLLSARGDYVLFVDAGVAISPGSLAFIAERLETGRVVWNAHTEFETGENLYGLFWAVVSSVAFGDYVDTPRETSFGVDDFDRFPKGTTCFFAPRELLLTAFASFHSHYADTRNSNDDGPIIRWIAARQRINIAPGFACTYTPRRDLRAFVRHAVHRGTVFVDGHSTTESRFFPIVTAFFPLSALLAGASLRQPKLLPAAAIGVSAAAGAVAARRGRTGREVAAFTLLAPVYATAHGIGMWRGLLLALAARRR